MRTRLTVVRDASATNRLAPTLVRDESATNMVYSPDRDELFHQHHHQPQHVPTHYEELRWARKGVDRDGTVCTPRTQDTFRPSPSPSSGSEQQLYRPRQQADHVVYSAGLPPREPASREMLEEQSARFVVEHLLVLQEEHHARAQWEMRQAHRWRLMTNQHASQLQRADMEADHEANTVELMSLYRARDFVVSEEVSLHDLLDRKRKELAEATALLAKLNNDHAAKHAVARHMYDKEFNALKDRRGIMSKSFHEVESRIKATFDQHRDIIIEENFIVRPQSDPVGRLSVWKYVADTSTEAAHELHTQLHVEETKTTLMSDIPEAAAPTAAVSSDEAPAVLHDVAGLLARSRAAVDRANVIAQVAEFDLRDGPPGTTDAA